eukprot:COSAG01_NODE_2168_length_8243_cov_2.796442_3_plen_191_part_00
MDCYSDLNHSHNENLRLHLNHNRNHNHNLNLLLSNLKNPAAGTPITLEDRALQELEVRQLTRQAQAQEEEEGEEYPLIVTRPHRGKQQEFVPSRTQRVSTFSPGTRDEALAVERARRRAKAAAQELGLDVLEVVRTEYERASGKAAPPGRWGNDIDWLQKKISECGGNPHVCDSSVAHGGRGDAGPLGRN